MTGCEVYRIEPLERFEISLEKLIKSHYRKNERARNSFLELVNDYIGQLRENPSSNSFSEDEGFPKGTYKSDFKFRKIRFRAPELDGAAKKCRFMYVVNETKRVVYLLWIYTHEEFRTRPSDDDLRREFVGIQQEAEPEQV
ncbi:hypothetical protein [Nostoc sp. DedQUE07]|uniref:hypothetical protein n=1 Tax=Nostoc sp. DedQUE07 TaxID=3075392 RepID=UPI00391911D1